MAVLSTPVIPSALRDVAELKIDELNRTKAAFKDRYLNNEAVHRAGVDHLKRVTTLLQEVKKHDPDMENDDDISILERFLKQAKNDKSVSQSKILRFEQQLLDKFAVTLRRMEMTSLHVDLLREEIIAQDATNSVREDLPTNQSLLTYFFLP